ncbi:MAG TPA: hypothetical protein VHB21_06000, partial [Minicystis sp.]|nr:hypothetical protein [Minicystis sp.]
MPSPAHDWTSISKITQCLRTVAPYSDGKNVAYGRAHSGGAPIAPKAVMNRSGTLLLAAAAALVLAAGCRDDRA